MRGAILEYETDELPHVTEAQFQEVVIEAAGYLGWRIYHTWLAKRSPAGFPDLVLARPPRVIFAEIKSATGKLRPEQDAWGELLRACPGVEYAVWRPAIWDAIVEVLR